MKHARLFFAVLTLSLSAFAEDSFTDPDAAGPDFAIQGEYAGHECGAQVIALGGGKFHIVGWENGLPGAVDDATKRVELDGERVGDRVTFRGNGWDGAIEDGKLTGTSDEGGKFELKRLERNSPTLGAKPPAGAIVLFDGTNADAWEGGKMDARNLLFCGTKSKQSFGDCTLHVEFRTPFMPAARGQARGNSGVYIQGRYECQVLDSFGLEGESNECGGIYQQSKPAVNMCYPPLSWQTYDIDFTAAKYDADGKKTTNARVTVKHNGVAIYENLELPKDTPGHKAEGPGPEHLYLQDHGNPVAFRNIWVVEKK